ncbi:MAG TPA: MgtC/SapB family protein [Aggregatilineales bacterium]|nr:MgtC/SapB family protein [Chloroflexota bacterium]HOA25372.1 MgtC/SapB family protein [Aggregatilineales bacterium]HPV07379.1 MgtC/SapB family protein [Aggregatilineales bacterium]HQE18656.1 MgtC/SapB family protein [Aggregatilineales bacterium]
MDFSDFLNIEPWWRFAVALLNGALIGLEREFMQQRRDNPDFAGIRTFSLVSLLGAVTGFLAAEFGIGPLLVALGGLILLGVSSYIGDFITTGQIGGITTEVSVLLAYVLGVLVMTDWAQVAVALAVIVSLLLALKDPLHGIARRMSTQDLRTTLEFALVAAVVLPILPNETIDPWGVVNPSQIWLLVVFVSGIGFGGYVLMKIVGTERGISITGVLGGIVSSTATTLSLSTQSKLNPALSRQFAQAIVLASTVMIPRVAIILIVVNAALLPIIALPFAAMLLTGIITVLFLRSGARHVDGADDVDVENPLKISTAVVFGLVFAVVLVIVTLAQEYLGNAGVYIAAMLTGLTGVDPITLSVGRLADQGALAATVAASAIVIATVMNTAAKVGIVMMVGSSELRRQIIWSLGAVVLVGAAAVGVLLLA